MKYGATCYKMDESLKCMLSERNQKQRDRLFDSIYIKYAELANSRESKLTVV